MMLPITSPPFAASADADAEAIRGATADDTAADEDVINSDTADRRDNSFGGAGDIMGDGS
jgi:hypothetical protein